MYLLYEVYDPAHATLEKAAETKPATGAKPEGEPVRVMTSIEFLSGSAKVFETPVIQATRINEPDRDAVAFQFDLPLDSLKPGTYICQINVIDDAGGTFTFPRTAVLIRPSTQAPPPSAPAAAGSASSSGR